MADYADWTESIELLGSEIMVPFDVQGAYIQVPMDLQGALIQMPVDIQGQYITLDINIESVAADVTLNVNITASAVTINMDIKAQSVAIKSQGEWSPQAGQQKYVTFAFTSLASGTESYSAYTVPAGKTLYVTHMGYTVFASAATDRDYIQTSWARIQNATAATDLAYIGGNGGNGLSFPTPLKVNAGSSIRIYVGNGATRNVHGWGSWGGYEI